MIVTNPHGIALISTSPRRKMLLETYGYDVEVIPPRAAESIGELPPAEIAVDNAIKKFLSVSFNGVGLAADTVVVLDDRILGKPGSEDEAREYLRALSGKTHEVITGYVIGTNGHPIVVGHEVTKVTFMQLTEFEIEYMLSSENLLDKAGAYAIQGSAGMFITSIEGDYTNVIGLPLPSIYRHLKLKFNILPRRWIGRS